ncbi:MAG: hypothetical protein LBB81_06000 [Treponema sp.]|nr:hypothetical protein [Treponema sp.]
MRKKNTILIIVILLFSGIMALTQEYNVPYLVPDTNRNEEAGEGELIAKVITVTGTPVLITRRRWYRSNAGGMALEEMPTRLSALRCEYSLLINFISRHELPGYLLKYYNDNFFIENRTLFRKAEETRKQWIFRDRNGSARFIAVFTEPKEEDEIEGSGEKGTIPVRYGFIEVYDENYSLSCEYKYFDDGSILKTDFFYKDGIIIKVQYSNLEKTTNVNANGGEDEINHTKGEYSVKYTDIYHYNRSYFLRSVERLYHMDEVINLSRNNVNIAFPQRIHDTARKENFLTEQVNTYPDFFGDLLVSKDNKMLFTTDERGRIITQTLADDDGTVIWEIKNNWSRDRILSISKKENGIELLTEFEYDSGGKRIIERNIKNGALERIVRTENNIDIEELYIDNVMVLRAVWEDGRKKSETRIRRN